MTRRRSMSALDAMFFPGLFWDGRAGDALLGAADGGALIPVGAALETQALVPLVSDVEMACRGDSLAQLVERLAHVRPLSLAPAVPAELAAFVADAPSYAPLFRTAFPELARDAVALDAVHVAMAIASYERTLRSDHTPWDRAQAGDEGALDAEALRGFGLFSSKAGCGCCHLPPWFTSGLYVNDGFSSDLWDRGRAELTDAGADEGAFRVPGLRNVGLREAGGLLHDGVGPGVDLPTLVSAYTRAPVVGGGRGLCFRSALSLDDSEQAAIVHFLRVGLTDPRVAAETAPFDHQALSRE